MCAGRVPSSNDYYSIVEAILPVVKLVVDEKDIMCINTETHKTVADEKVLFVAKYIKAYQDQSSLYPDTRKIDERLNAEMEATGEQLTFDECESQQEAIDRLEALVSDGDLLNKLEIRDKAFDFSNRTKLMFFVNLLHRRFKAFTSQTFLWNQQLDRFGSILFEQYFAESWVLCTEDFEYSLENWKEYEINFLVRDSSAEDNISHLILYPPGQEGKVRNNKDLQSIVRGGEEEMLRLGEKERLVKKISHALGITNVARIHDVIAKRQFVLTAEIALKLIMIHERKLSRCPMIIEGETGVGKTFPLEVYAELINEASVANRDRLDCPLLVPQLCLWLRTKVLESDAAETWFAAWDTLQDGSELLSEEFGSYAEVVGRLKERNFDDESFLKLWVDIGAKMQRVDDVGVLEQHPAAQLLTWIQAVPKEVPLIDVPAELQEQFSTRKVDSIFNGAVDVFTKLSELAQNALEELLRCNRHSLFKRKMIHPGVTSHELEEFMEGVITLGERIELASANIDKPAIEQVVFFDEMNTAECLGALKEILVDRTVNGKRIPKSIFIVAAINPKVGAPTRRSTVAEVVSWLKSGRYASDIDSQMFEENDINGATLLRFTKTEFTGILGMSDSEAKRLVRVLNGNDDSADLSDDANAPEVHR